MDDPDGLVCPADRVESGHQREALVDEDEDAGQVPADWVAPVGAADGDEDAGQVPAAAGWGGCEDAICLAV